MYNSDTKRAAISVGDAVIATLKNPGGAGVPLAAIYAALMVSTGCAPRGFSSIGPDGANAPYRTRRWRRSLRRVRRPYWIVAGRLKLEHFMAAKSSGPDRSRIIPVDRYRTLADDLWSVSRECVA
jgi:hypothetical protein